MPLALSPGAQSLCFTCKHWDWYIQLAGWESAWGNLCRHPAEYQAGDDVKECKGYEKDGNTDID